MISGPSGSQNPFHGKEEVGRAGEARPERMLLISATGEVTVIDPLAGARTGCRCLPPDLPDRCLCFDENLRHRPAEGYVERRIRGRVWRYGVCRKCGRGEGRRKVKVVWYENQQKGEW